MANRRLLGPTTAGTLILAVILCGALTPAVAQTTSVGDVEFNEPGSGDITVGFASNSSTFGFGQFTIDNVSETFSEFVVADQQLTIGEVFVFGPAASLTLTAGGFDAGQALLVGEEGTGTFTASGGALVTLDDNDATLEIGEQTTGFGRVFIDGRSESNLPTRLVVEENIIVGGAGIGELTLSGGALAYHPDIDDAQLIVGQEATGRGLVVLEGGNTLWQAPRTVNIGVVGSGELRVNDGATFDADNNLLPDPQVINIGARGYVNLSGGRFLTEQATVNGRLGGGGLVSGAINVSTTGELSSGPGETLRFVGGVTNNGLVAVAGTPESRSAIEFVGPVTNAAAAPPALPGRITVADGEVRFDQIGAPFTNSGTLASTGGDTEFHGEIVNDASGQIVIGNASRATFFDNVTATAGMIEVGVGSTALFFSDLTLAPFSTLSIGLDESATDDDFDAPVQVIGAAELSGPITFQLEAGFIPAEGDVIPLIATTGGLTVDSLSTQSTGSLPDGLAWEILTTESGIFAQVQSPIAVNTFVEGDGNGDGIVSAADFVTARDQQDTAGIFSAFANFGAGTATSVNVAAEAVPEPSTLVLATMGLLAACRRRR